MSTTPWTDSAFDYLIYERNRKLFPPEELAKYSGRHIAWSLDGTRIVADGDGYDELFDRLAELGIDPCTTVIDFVPDPDTSYIFGLCEVDNLCE